MVIIKINDDREETTEIELACAMIGGITTAKAKKNTEDIKKALESMKNSTKENIDGTTVKIETVSLTIGSFSLVSFDACVDALDRCKEYLSDQIQEQLYKDTIANMFGFEKEGVDVELL